MKKKFKLKALSILMAMLMVATIIPMGAISSFAETSGDFEYYCMNYMQFDSKVIIEITKYKGAGGDVTIPLELNGCKVKSIGEFAFSGCTGVTSITIPDGITNIGEFAFSGCTGLTSVTIPDSVTKLDLRIFEECTSLTAINVSEGNTMFSSIDGVVYSKDKTSLLICPNGKVGEFTIPNNVTSIDQDVFKFCKGLTSVTIGNSVTSISGWAFQNLTGLKSVTIGNGVTSIGEQAFEGCTGLTNVIIPDSVTSIGGDAFYNTPFYDSLPDGEVYLGKVFYEYKDLVPDNVTINIKQGTISITKEAFGSCNLKSVTIPDSVTSIGYDAFDCSPFYDSLPDGEVYLGKVLYNYKGTMPKNTEINIKPGTVSIENNAFWRRTELINVTIPDSVTSIGDDTFYDCSGLTSIMIPNSVTSIGDNAFYGCKGLKDVTIPDSVTSIGFEAFNGCTGLTSVTIGNGLTSIGGWAFYGCTGLTNVKIGNSVTNIGRSAFERCSNLTSVEIPNSTTTIGDKAFFKCTGLRNLVLSNNVTNIDDGTFYGCKELTSVTIPNSVTGIGENAFYECSGLTSIMIPNSVTSIGDDAFYGCKGLTSITILDSVTSIGTGAFYGCQKTFKGYKGSFAEIYADYWGIKFIDIDAPQEDVILHAENFDYKVISEADKTIEIIKFTGTGTEILVPDTINGYTVAKITDNIFPNGFTLKGQKGSLAEKYATANGLNFIDIDILHAENFDYKVISETDKTIEIVKFTGTGTEVLVPDSIDGYTVAKITDNIFPNGFTLKGKKGGLAEKYAIANGLKFIDIDAPQEDVILHAENFDYKVISETDKTIEIVKFTGTGTEILVPDTINGYTVAKITDGIFPNGFTLKGQKGSVAENYAVANGLTFVDVTAPPVPPIPPVPTRMLGDVNGDGKVTAADAILALRAEAKLKELSPEEFTAADVTGDGKVTAADAIKILRFEAKLITAF